MQLALVGHELLGGGAAGFRGGRARWWSAVNCSAQLGQVRFALRQLLAQFVFQPVIRRGGSAPAQQPADEEAQRAPDQTPISM